MPLQLNASPEDFREMGRCALEMVARFQAEVPDLPVMPLTNAQAVRDLLAEPLPRTPTDIGELLAKVQNVIYPLSRHNAHPRFFGYVGSPGTAVAAVGDLLTAGLNANVTSWRSSPAAAELEHVVIDWLKEMLGYPRGAVGLLVSGGSMANLSALAAARTSKAPDFGKSGTTGGKRLRIYASEEAHFSIHKGARLLGFGSENVQGIRTDRMFRMDVDDLIRAIRNDREAGFKPACIVATAGTVNTGAFDPLSDIADIAEREGLWMHVDGAYGGFSALAHSAKPLFTGIERADSVSLDPHKWLYMSVGCGCVLYRDPDIARATFGHDAEYVRPVGLTRDEAFAFWDFGPELSRPFRALSVWMQMKVFGAEALGEAIQRNIECAQHLERLVSGTDDFEMLAPAGLSIFCFRHHPRGFNGDLDAFNERVLLSLQRGGSSYLSNARINGQFALRGCVVNYRTTARDMERLLEDVRGAARLVG